MGKITKLRKKKRNAKKREYRATKTLHKLNFPAGRKILEDSSLQQKRLGDNVLSDIEMASTSTVTKMNVSDDQDLEDSKVEVLSRQARAGTSSNVDENRLPKKRVVKPRLGLQQPCVYDDSEVGSSLKQETESKIDIFLVSSSSGADENTLPEKSEEESRSTRRRKIVSDCARKQVVDSVTRRQTRAIISTDEDEYSPVRKKKKVAKRRIEFQDTLISSSCKETLKTAKTLNRRTKTRGDHAMPSTSKQVSESEMDTSTIESKEDFKRYGVHVPTFQEIMAYRKECEKMDKEVEFINAAIAEPILKLPEEPQKQPVPILDCKHITEDQLEILLEQNYLFLYNIFHGITKSERHDRFKATKFHRITFSKSNLIHNTSMIVFSYEQKRMMLKYLYRKFDNEGEFHTQTDYFFKVLLPELCTKIFMDTYQMTKEKAESYLAVRPAGNASILQMQYCVYRKTACTSGDLNVL